MAKDDPFICPFDGEKHGPFSKNCKNRTLDVARGMLEKPNPDEELDEVLEMHARFYAGNETGLRMNTGAAKARLLAYIEERERLASLG